MQTDEQDQEEFGTSHGIDSEFITHGSSSGRGLSWVTVGGRTSISGTIRGLSAVLSRALSNDDSSRHKCLPEGGSSYCVDICYGNIIGASRLADSIRRVNMGSEMIRSLLSGLTRVSSNDGHLSSGSRIGTSDMARNVDLSLISYLETIGSGCGVSGHSSPDILDAISSGPVEVDTVSFRRSGSGRTSGSRRVSHSVLGGKTDCKKRLF
ncbi:unnamed protein product [Mytilus edulis]|uniref:Uncharacterized protein n=1 Tax=Mytilus edulis TaxID=6550 RepID=A0A8S3ST40_MYTED|nr:unnamed protein product [Mytilus edulis]